MASTNKTKNLGLCQWVETDPFLREDMNGDFAKIDEICGEVRERKLLDITIPKAVNTVQLDFTGIDIEQFFKLEIHFDVSLTRFSMRMNGVTDSVYPNVTTVNSNTQDRMSATNGQSQIIITRQNFIHRLYAGFRYENLSRADFPTLNTLEVFSSKASETFAAGDHITVWGFRK